MNEKYLVEKLLNSESPSIRYRMQRDFLEIEPDENLRERILASKQVEKIFKKMHPDGYWLHKGSGDGIDYSMSSSTHFILSYLAELGLGKWDDRIDKAVRRYWALKEPQKWLSPPDYLTGQSCLYSQNIRTFIMLGYKDDVHMAPRIKTLLNEVRDDNGYLCVRKSFKDSTKSCIRGTTKALMAYAELPEFWEHQSCKRTVDYFLSRNVYYRKPELTEKIRGGLQLSFPFTIDVSLLEPLYALSTMGYGRKRALSDAWNDLDSQRDASGYYKLQWNPPVPFKPGERGEGNEWVTFYALTSMKRAGKLKGY
ncbi:MAG: hypothetical protein JXN10_07400 [Clostridia bacterium]|nr:hypothetical protein [Clostridia bacterium]MBN2883337.1 hypothetical protein [Clostridia bacterium]